MIDNVYNSKLLCPSIVCISTINFTRLVVIIFYLNDTSSVGCSFYQNFGQLLAEERLAFIAISGSVANPSHTCKIKSG